MASQIVENPQPALIFIPDISGFTRFVSDTDLSHSRHIVEELLGILIDANQIGLEVSEIEGDAILFYRFGRAPSAAELLAQVQRMFVDFHAHLKKYETHRICHCGACRSAHRLTLKFITHYGSITRSRVKDRDGLFGREVIVAHRLMKNDIENHEYALVTQPLIDACANWVDVPTVAWAKVEHGEQQYDSGPVRFCHLPLAPLMDYVPEPRPEDYRIPGHTSRVMHSEALIQAPIDLVFDVAADLPWRAKWIVNSMPEVVDINHPIFQEGVSHRCLADGPVIVTHNIDRQQDTVSFSETDRGRTFSVVYTLRRDGPDRTRVTADAFMPRNPLKALFFRLFERRKLLEVYRQTWNNLDHYCRSIREQGHHNRLVAAAEQAA